MSLVERHRERRSSRRHRTLSSKSRDPYADNATGLTDQAESRPHTIQDLREARLAYINQPATPRQSRMKYEYSRTVPVRVQPVINSRDIVAETTSRTSYRRRRRVSSAPRGEDSDAQYVYRTDTFEGEPRRQTSQSRNVSADGRRRVKRRVASRTHSSPVIKDDSDDHDVDNAPLQDVRPRLRKSVTTSEKTPRPSHNRSISLGQTDPMNSASKPVATEKRRTSSIWGELFGTKSVTPERKVSCLTCGDDVSSTQAAKLPCKHCMCHLCLKRVFKLSITDPAHMPPKCCTDQHIDVKHVDSLFDASFKKHWNRKFKEYKAKNRVYCPMKGCGEWIQSKHMSMEKGRKIGKCPSCKTLVCGICNMKMHKSKDCPKDPATQEFVEVAKRAGWKKCYRCSATVELKEGCNHMTCRCTAEFCMVCGAKWKSCDCPWFSYGAVDGMGDPIRFQQEMDRRRAQEQHDEDLARRMQAHDLNNNDIFNMFAQPPTANFVRQAQQTLAANYQQADQAARGLFYGLMNIRPGRRQLQPPPDTPNADDDDIPPPIQPFDPLTANVPPIPSPIISQTSSRARRHRTSTDIPVLHHQIRTTNANTTSRRSTRTRQTSPHHRNDDEEVAGYLDTGTGHAGDVAQVRRDEVVVEDDAFGFRPLTVAQNEQMRRMRTWVGGFA